MHWKWFLKQKYVRIRYCLGLFAWNYVVASEKVKKKTDFSLKCCILSFDTAKHAIPKTAEEHIPLAWASLADKIGQGKIPWYSHRLMHRKRVTCELHDSYFRLMTIKHAIPKIEWAIELLYNSVKTGSQLF